MGDGVCFRTAQLGGTVRRNPRRRRHSAISAWSHGRYRCAGFRATGEGGPEVWGNTRGPDLRHRQIGRCGGYIGAAANWTKSSPARLPCAFSSFAAGRGWHEIEGNCLGHDRYQRWIVGRSGPHLRGERGGRRNFGANNPASSNRKARIRRGTALRVTRRG